MSWAEIKKAVNSNLDVPLNEQLSDKFGLQLVTQKYISGTSMQFILNTTGWLYVCCFVGEVNVMTTINGTNRKLADLFPQSPSGTTAGCKNHFALIPISKESEARIEGVGSSTEYTYLVFAYGGGI